MKKAWIENGKIRDVAQGDPFEQYHPDVAENYSEDVPDEAENGDLWDGQTLTKPAPAETPVEDPTPPIVSQTDFLLLFTSQERVKARELRLSDPILNDFWLLLEAAASVHLYKSSVQSGVEYTLSVVKAAGVSVDVPVRKAQIISGKGD